MTLFYITALEYPSVLANREQVIKMCEAFAKNDTVKLFVRKLHESKEDLFHYYGVMKSFEIREMSYTASHIWPKSYWTSIAIAHEIIKEPPETIFYIRDVLLAFFLTITSRRFSKNYFFEVHSLEKFPIMIYRRVLQKSCGIISTNYAKKNYIIEKFGVPAEKILVAPNGFDSCLFANAPDREQARRELKFGENEKIVLYAGSMQSWKGADLIQLIAQALPDIQFIIVGASKNEQKDNVQTIKAQPYTRVPLFLKAADMLIAPYRGDDARVQLYFSPIKVFEYMASGMPMIASNIPAIREIANETCAFFARAGDVESFAREIRTAFERPDEMYKRAQAAQQRVRQFSWDCRAEHILEFIRVRMHSS